MTLASQTVDFYIEYAVQTVVLCLQTFIVRMARDRAKQFGTLYHRRILHVHLALLVGILLGIACSSIVYIGFAENDYTDLLLLPPTTAKAVFYLSYRIVYAVQLFIYQTGLYGLFYVQFDRFSSILQASSPRYLPTAIKSCYLVFLAVLLAVVAYYQIYPSSWGSWQNLNQSWVFHYLHAAWFFVVCLSDVCITVVTFLLVLKWKKEQTAIPLNEAPVEDAYVGTSPILMDSRVFEYSIPLKLKLLLAADLFVLVVMLFLHLFNNAIFSNPREQAITFKFCYLVVSLHIMCSFLYLDLPRQVLTVILGQKKPNDPEATVHQQMQLSVTKSVSWEARTPGRREKVLYNPELGAIDQVLEEYFNVKPHATPKSNPLGQSVDRSSNKTGSGASSQPQSFSPPKDW
ncbi:hypothetical protein HDV03_001464 [Kappamyces sp. JEL0829]|nr:hypothetical protein HDV03_001464 [Kappamyces sp. JEL0829]